MAWTFNHNAQLECFKILYHTYSNLLYHKKVITNTLTRTLNFITEHTSLEAYVHIQTNLVKLMYKFTYFLTLMQAYLPHIPENFCQSTLKTNNTHYTFISLPLCYREITSANVDWNIFVLKKKAVTMA